MPVGKGSLVRASKANTSKAELVTAEDVVKTEKALLVNKTDNVHEKKFEAVSNIKSELPVYLL